MKYIHLEPVVHRNEKRLLVKFPYDQELISLIKKVEGATFSNTHKSWHIPNNKKTLKELFRLFKGIAFIDTTAVAENSEQIKNHSFQSTMGSIQSISGNEKKGESNLPAFEMLDDGKRADVLKFKYWLKQKRYSDNTIKTYIDALKIFFRFFHEKPLHKISNKDMLRFNNEYILANKYSVTYQS